MDFRLTDEQQALQQSVRQVVRREIEPVLARHNPDQPLPKPVYLEILQQLAPYGYLGTTIPEVDGGAGLDYLTVGLLIEELPPEISIGTFITGSCARRVYALGTPSHRPTYLASLLAGTKIGCGAITEPNVGSNPAQIETTARRQGDAWVLNGTKMWITNGAVADIATVVASVDRQLGHRGLAVFLVDRDESPFETRPIRTIGERMGHLGELVFGDCAVPETNLLVPPGEGFQSTLEALQTARCFVALLAVGIARRALAAAVEYTTTRTQFGRPIGRFQLIQAMLADMAMEVDAARLLAWRALDLVQHGQRAVAETSMAKAYATEMAVRVTSAAMQVHGAYGLSVEYPLERLFRDARMLTIPDGTTQIQKLIIGRELTGLRAFD